MEWPQAGNHNKKSLVRSHKKAAAIYSLSLFFCLLPLTLVSSALEAGMLFLVSDAPVIEYQVNAVYPVRSGRKELIKEVLNYFHIE